MSARNVAAQVEHDGARYLVIGYSPRRPACLEMLSPGEIDVIDRWLDGESVRGIAATRKVAARTVNNQIANAYRTLGVGSRDEFLQLLTGWSRVGKR